MDICYLCKEPAELRLSHIVPSFVGKWLKDTSVTGFLRQATNQNLRRQDIPKQPLLCSSCEGRLSKYEDRFARSVFYPYVRQELDDWGVSKGELRSIPYDDWLLKFVISVQWRVLTTSTKLEDAQLENERIRSRFADAMDAALCNWANYLLGYRDTSGDERHYIIFLQNLAAATSYFPERLNDNVNGYLLRTVDSTIAYSSKNLLLYTKMGPIVLITGLRPYELKGMKGAKIRKRGSVNTAQKLDNADVNEFVLFTRPNEAMSRLNISEKQYRKISADVERRILSSKHLHSVHALESDFLLRERRRRT